MRFSGKLRRGNVLAALQLLAAVFVCVFHSSYISINEPHFDFIAGLSHFFERNHPTHLKNVRFFLLFRLSYPVIFDPFLWTHAHAREKAWRKSETPSGENAFRTGSAGRNRRRLLRDRLRSAHRANGDHKLAMTAFPASSKTFREVKASNAPAADSAANRSEPSSPNLSAIRSADTPETVTLFSPSA